MKLFHYIILAVVLVAGLGASLWVIPNGTELSAMYFRANESERARSLYEKRLAAGDRSADVIVPLAEIYVQSGEVERAVNLLRSFGTTAADHLELFQRIGTLERYQQNIPEYVHTLEAISRVAESEDSLRELASHYRFTNENSKLIPVLQTLIARHQAEPAEYLELANLLAIGKRLADAANLLEQFEARHPRDITPDTVEFLISVLVDSGQGSRALARAARWIKSHPDSAGITRLAALFRNKGQLSLARQLLASLGPAIDRDPTLLAEWVQLQLAENSSNAAFDRLDRLYRSHALPEQLIEPFLDLALARGRTALAFELAELRGFRRLSEILCAALLERALEESRLDFASRLVSARGDAFLKRRPLLGARLAYARGDRQEAARLVQVAETVVGLSSAEHLAIAGLDASLSRPHEAAAQLDRIDLDSAPEDLLLETARLYITIGKARDGVLRFDRLRSHKPTLAISRGWLLVAAASGRGEAASWLASASPGSVPELLLRDVYFIARDEKQPNLALATSERLFREFGGDSYRLMLANSLTAAGRPLEGLFHARALLAHEVSTGAPNRPGAEEAYTAALLAAIRESHGSAADSLRKELREFWSAKLEGVGRDERQELDLIYGLLDLGAWDEVLPHLKRLARKRSDLAPLYVEAAVKAGHLNEAIAFLESDLARADLPQETREARVYALIERVGEVEALPYIRQLAYSGSPGWIGRYEETLNRLGRSSELLEFWENRLATANVRPEEKRAIGYKLIDHGKTEWARSVFADLARSARPDSPDVAELLFLSGPKPVPEILEWLEERASHSDIADRATWLNLLLQAGAADRVARVVSAALPLPGRGGAISDAYVRALAELHQHDILADLIAREAAALTDRQSLLNLARLAREVAELALAGPAYERLLVLNPAEPEALHWLGILAYGQARYSVAEARLSRLIDSFEADYQDDFYYAEILWRKGIHSRARIYYGRALRLIEQMPSLPPEAQGAHAQALFRCGYVERAIGEYRTLLAVNSQNDDVRADFAATLLEAGRYEEAAGVLSGAADPSRSTRVALLRAQLLSAMARRSEALKLIENTAAAHPGSANVIAALGLAEQAVGRNRRAQDLVDRAAEMDPNNEDLRAARAALQQDRSAQFRGEAEARRVEGMQTEDLIRVLGSQFLSRALHLQFFLEQDHASIHALRYADGHTGPFEGIRRRGEASLEWESERGLRIKGSLLTGASSVGAGLTLTRPDGKGATTLQLDLGRPDWDYMESLAQNGLRDRLRLSRDLELSPRVSARLEAGVNRYSLPGEADAAESAGVNAGINILLNRRPNIALDYEFDGEYRISVKDLSAGAGRFQPLALASREIHSAGIHIDKPVTRGLRAAGSAGVAADRLGGHAPFWTADVTYDAGRHFGVRFDYERRPYAWDSSHNLSILRVGLFWRF